MPDLPPPDLPPLRDVIARAGLTARKGLGQHFLLDLNLTRRIARSAGDIAHSTILEIGPGPGGLTRGLLEEGAAEVVAVERDARCVEALSDLVAAYPGRLTLTLADALGFDAEPLFAKGRPVRIVANLPYNVGTPLLIGWLAEPRFASMTLMFQKEVAERLYAAPGDEAYGRLSVITAFSHVARRVFDVPAAAFTPPPKVVSTVVELIPRPAPAAQVARADLEKVTAAAFGQRRKMLRASLKSLLPEPEKLLTALDIDPTRRAETLSVEEFCRITMAWRA